MSRSVVAEELKRALLLTIADVWKDYWILGQGNRRLVITAILIYLPRRFR